MENLNIYESIGKRTGGDIYIGTVGPVRSGKSTFIKRFMELMVIPNVTDFYERRRILDELPQSGSGKTIMTTEPKFIPAEAAELDVRSGMSLKVKLVDCVGYLVPGAAGHVEEGQPRMVATPWSIEKMPFEQAAELGTEKVINDHATVGVVITSDGTIETMDRDDYREAEQRVINQLIALHKPFITVVNSTQPEGYSAINAAEEIEEKFSIPVIRMDCARATEDDLEKLLEKLLGRFPVKEVIFRLPGYIDGLEKNHWVKNRITENIREWADSFETVDDIVAASNLLYDEGFISEVDIKKIDMATGSVDIEIKLPEQLYYKIITELMGEEVENDYEFFSLLKEFALSKRKYDKLRHAMEQVEERGYGIVEPKLNEMLLDEPEVFKQGNKYGVRITAKAPTLHIIRTDITTEIAPVVGSDSQSEELVEKLKNDMQNSPNGIWDTNLLGKSLYEMMSEQMETKIASVPDNIRIKMQKSLQKISDEGKEYFICIVI